MSGMQSYQANIYYLYLIKIAKWFMLTGPVLMLYYKQADLSLGESFTLKAVYSLIIVLSEVPSGYFADRWGRKKMLIAGTVLGCLGFALYSIEASFIIFLLAEIVLGLGQSFVSGSDSALLYDSLKELKREHKYVKFEGWNYAVGNFAEVFAALAGGFLAAYSIRSPFVVQTFIALLGVPAAILLLDPVHHYRSQVMQNMGQAFKAVFDEVKNNRELFWVLVFSSVIGASSLLMAWAFPLLANYHGMDFEAIGMFAAGLNLCLAITATFAYQVEKCFSNHILLLLLSSLFVLGFIASASPVWGILFALLCLFYVARGIAIPVLKNRVHTHTPSDMRATVLSVRSLFVRLLFVMVYPLTGFLGDCIGLPYAFVVYGVLLLFMAGASFRFLLVSKRE